MMVFLTLFVVPVDLSAGAGTAREVDGVLLLDFVVSVRFLTISDQIIGFQTVIQRASEILADATDGQVRFGEIAILTSSRAGSEAEIWIHPRGGAKATFGGYGTRGMHINLSDSGDFSNGTEIDAYTVAHEMAHHLWNVQDEYTGPCGSTGCAECEAPPHSPTASFCLMDSYKALGGNLGNSDEDTPTLNEFCVKSNHDPDRDTGQHAVHYKSCWETIATHPTRALTLPEGLPKSAPPNVPEVEFVSLQNEARYVLVLDRSLSMATPDGGAGATRLERAQQAAEIFANAMEIDQRLGVISYSSDAEVELELTSIDSDDVKDEAIGIIGGLSPGGNTAIGLGLIEARDQIAPLDDSWNQPVVLLTDGFGNVPPDELGVVPSLIEEKIPVFAVGIGSEIHSGRLIEIAQRTGGLFFHVRSAADLPALYFAINAELNGWSLLGSPAPFAPAGFPRQEFVRVDDRTDILTVLVTTPDAAASLALTSPTGRRIDEATAAVDSRVDYRAGRNHAMLRVRGLEEEDAGLWTVSVDTSSDGYEVLASSDTPDYAISAMTTKPQYDCEEPIVLLATPQFEGVPVAGAIVSARVERPDGSVGLLTLVDDGDLEKGDSIPGDGTYSVSIETSGVVGPYSFEVGVVNVNGETTPGEGISNETSPIETVPPFSRRVRTTTFAVCQDDCNGNGNPDAFDLLEGISSDDDGDGIPDECQVRRADLEVTISDGTESLVAGGGNTYSVTVTNRGPDEVSGAGVRVEVPPALQNLSWTCASSPGSRCAASGTGPLADSPDLLPGGQVTYLVEGTVDASYFGPLETGARILVPSGTVETDPGDNLARDTTLVFPPAGVVAMKQVAGRPIAGGRLYYTILLLNGGPFPQADNPGDELVDVLAPGLTLESATADSGTIATVGTSVVTWNGGVPVGGVVEIVIEATLGADLVLGTVIENQATVMFDGDGDGVNESSAPSDDPGSGGSDDSTPVTVVGVVSVPGLHPVGTILLALLLTGIGILRAGRMG